MTFMTKSWKVCRVREASPFRDKFSKRLRDHARPAQICFVQIMQRHNGNPNGVEYQHHTDPDRWAFVLEDASQTGFRVQYFDLNGFSGHTHFEDLPTAVDEMITRGYRIEDVGALDRVSVTTRWAEGMAWLERMQQHNSSWQVA